VPSVDCRMLTSLRVGARMLPFRRTGMPAAHVVLKHTGTVKWFDPEKGYGFIIPSDGQSDVFVHQSQIHAEGFRSLREAEPVEFELETRPDGRVTATDVTGPAGAYVLGAVRPMRQYDDGYGTAPGRRHNDRVQRDADDLL